MKFKVIFKQFLGISFPFVDWFSSKEAGKRLEEIYNQFTLDFEPFSVNKWGIFTFK